MAFPLSTEKGGICPKDEGQHPRNAGILRGRRRSVEGWRGPLQAGSDTIKNARIGPEKTHLCINREGEYHDFLKCVRRRKAPCFPVEIGHRGCSVRHLANISIQLGRKLRWAPVREEFANDEAANALRRERKLRTPWKFPV